MGGPLYANFAETTDTPTILIEDDIYQFGNLNVLYLGIFPASGEISIYI